MKAFKSFFILSLITFSLQVLSNEVRQYYSQAEQDKYLNEQIFKNKRNGFFVDIGAYDGVKFSNSYFFEKHLGWTGLCIEPIPHVFKQLSRSRKCICIEGCASNYTGTADFLFVNGPSEMLSGLASSYDPRHLTRVDREIKSLGGSKEKIKVKCYNINKLLAKYKLNNIDFMSLDTEGSELTILKSINYNKFNIKAIVVENNYKDLKIRSFLNNKGYKLVKVLHDLDEVYVKN